MLSIWKKDETVLGKLFHKVLSNLYPQNLAHQFKSAYETGEIFEVTEQGVEVITDNKVETVYFSFALKPIKDAVGKTRVILCTARNTTKRIAGSPEKRTNGRQQFRFPSSDRICARCNRCFYCEIGVSSILGEGSIFWFTLPVLGNTIFMPIKTAS